MTENQIEALFRIKDEAENFIVEMKDFARQISPYDNDYSKVEKPNAYGSCRSYGRTMGNG